MKYDKLLMTIVTAMLLAVTPVLALSDVALAGGISLGVAFVVIALLDMFLLRGKVFGAIGKIPAKIGLRLSAFTWAVVFLIIGVLMLGGIGATWSTLTASVSGITTTTTTPTTPQASACIISQARYIELSSGVNTKFNSNWTFTPAGLESYYMDNHNLTASSIGDSSLDVNGTLLLEIADAPTTGSECNALLYIIAPSAYNENDGPPNDLDVYTIVNTGTTDSEFKGLTYPNNDGVIKRVQNVYLNDGSVATTSSSKERTYVNFGAGEKTNTLGIGLDFDVTANDKLKKSGQYEFLIKQQLGSSPSSSDPTIYTLIYRKGVKSDI